MCDNCEATPEGVDERYAEVERLDAESDLLSEELAEHYGIEFPDSSLVAVRMAMLEALLLNPEDHSRLCWTYSRHVRDLFRGLKDSAEAAAILQVSGVSFKD